MCHTRMLALSPDELTKHDYSLFVLLLHLRTRTILCEVLYRQRTKGGPCPKQLADALQDSALFCITEFHMSFANVSNRIRVTPGQL